MKLTARDLMTTTFHTLLPSISVDQAVREFKEASRIENQNVFGMMVLDEQQKLVGILSIFDILLFLRPKHTHIWGMMEDIDVIELIDQACKKTDAILVSDLMTPDVVTVSPNTHKFMIMDIMIKRHIRRLPVVEDSQVLGIVYISDLFYDVLDRFAEEG